MILKRKPSADDRVICQLIRRELIPLNEPELRPAASSDRVLKKRLNQGDTFVWRLTGVPHAMGFIAMVNRRPELCIDLLAVDRRYRGRGIGSELLSFAEQYGRRRGCRHMALYVNNTNARGIRFYRKHGMYLSRHDEQLQCFVMEKWL